MGVPSPGPGPFNAETKTWNGHYIKPYLQMASKIVNECQSTRQNQYEIVLNLVSYCELRSLLFLETSKALGPHKKPTRDKYQLPFTYLTKLAI